MKHENALIITIIMVVHSIIRLCACKHTEGNMYLFSYPSGWGWRRRHRNKVDAFWRRRCRLLQVIVTLKYTITKQLYQVSMYL